jgi:hypothetical protein
MLMTDIKYCLSMDQSNLMLILHMSLHVSHKDRFLYINRDAKFKEGIPLSEKSIIEFAVRMPSI